jgi:hypothetical protein
VPGRPKIKKTASDATFSTAYRTERNLIRDIGECLYDVATIANCLSDWDGIKEDPEILSFIENLANTNAYLLLNIRGKVAHWRRIHVENRPSRAEKKKKHEQDTVDSDTVEAVCGPVEETPRRVRPDPAGARGRVRFVLETSETD